MTQLEKQAPEPHTLPSFPHLEICVHLALFLFVYFLGGRLMNRGISSEKNPEPNSVPLPASRAYITRCAFLAGLPLRPTPSSSPLSPLRTPRSPHMLLFRPPKQPISLEASGVPIQVGVGAQRRDNMFGDGRPSGHFLFPKGGRALAGHGVSKWQGTLIISKDRAPQPPQQWSWEAEGGKAPEKIRG